MLRFFVPRLMLPLLALGLAGVLGGCIAYPTRGGGYYSAPYYSGPSVAFGDGWGRGYGHHGRGHHGRGHHGGHDRDD